VLIHNQKSRGYPQDRHDCRKTYFFPGGHVCFFLIYFVGGIILSSHPSKTVLQKTVERKVVGAARLGCNPP
jgi:hypothetical protein